MFTFFNLPLRCSAPVRAWGQAEVLISNYYLLFENQFTSTHHLLNVIDVLTEMMTRVPSSAYCIVF